MCRADFEIIEYLQVAYVFNDTLVHDKPWPCGYRTSNFVDPSFLVRIFQLEKYSIPGLSREKKK